MQCLRCGSENHDEDQICARCGSRLKLRCQVCQSENAIGQRFCGECGAALEPGPPPHELLSNDRGIAGERRHLTILFSDLVGSTELAGMLDPEEWRDALAGYQQAAAGAIGRFGGRVSRYMGDGVMAFFGYPAAHDK